MILEDLFFNITSSELQRQFLPFKILFILVSLILAGFIFYILKRTEWLKYQWGQDLVEFKAFKAFEAVGFVKRWERTKTRLKKGWEPEAKLAIIEADQLLDDLLKRMGYVGESLGERLKQLDEKILPDIEQVWEAHKIRNNLVHDPNYKLSFGKAQNIIKVYGKAFQKLEAL